MTFRHIECALTVAATGSINNAARKLLVSQPYLSGIIASLEKELGYALFIRSNQGIKCTPEGLLFIQHAKKIMSEMEEIQSIGSKTEPPLSIATYYSRFVTDSFVRFHTQSEETFDDRCREMGNMEVIDALSRHEFTMGIIYHAMSKLSKFKTLAQINNLVYHTLFEHMGTYLIMAGNHPLAKKERITLEDIRSNAIVFYDDVSTVLYMMDHLKINPSSKRISVSDRSALMDALLSGEYFSIINTPYPKYEGMYILKDLNDCLPEDADFEVGCGFLTHRSHQLTHREQEFLRFLQH